MEDYKKYKLVLQEEDHEFYILHQTDLFWSKTYIGGINHLNNIGHYVSTITCPEIQGHCNKFSNNTFEIDSISYSIYLRGHDDSKNHRTLSINSIYNVNSQIEKCIIKDLIIEELILWSKEYPGFDDWQTEYKKLGNIHYF